MTTINRKSLAVGSAVLLTLLAVAAVIVLAHRGSGPKAMPASISGSVPPLPTVVDRMTTTGTDTALGLTYNKLSPTDTAKIEPSALNVICSKQPGCAGTSKATLARITDLSGRAHDGKLSNQLVWILQQPGVDCGQGVTDMPKGSPTCTMRTLVNADTGVVEEILVD